MNALAASNSVFCSVLRSVSRLAKTADCAALTSLRVAKESNRVCEIDTPKPPGVKSVETPLVSAHVWPMSPLPEITGRKPDFASGTFSSTDRVEARCALRSGLLT